jgi:hypothetical protein
MRQHALLKTRQPVFVPKSDDCFSVFFIPEAKLTGRIADGKLLSAEQSIRRDPRSQKFLNYSLEHLCGPFVDDDQFTVGGGNIQDSLA